MVLFIAGGARFAIGLTLKPIVDQFGWGRSELGIAVGLLQVVSAVAKATARGDEEVPGAVAGM